MTEADKLIQERRKTRNRQIITQFVKHGQTCRELSEKETRRNLLSAEDWKTAADLRKEATENSFWNPGHKAIRSDILFVSRKNKQVVMLDRV